MKKVSKLNILLVAEEAAGAHALRLITSSQHTLVAVLTTLPRLESNTVRNELHQKSGAMKKSLNSNLITLANNFEIPVLDSNLVKNPEFALWIITNQIDVLLNIHSLYRICPEVTKATCIGAFNLHPGPLPDYAGLNAPSWAVYNQESHHAVTLHHISEIIDSGFIAYQTQFSIGSKDTGLTVSIKCAQEGLKLIEQLLNQLSSDPHSIPSIPQEKSVKNPYKRNQIPGDGYIQWTESAQKIDSFIRACNYYPFVSPWGEPKTKWRESEISILKIETTNQPCHEKPGTIGQLIKNKISIATSDFWILVDKCRIEGKLCNGSSLLTPGDFLTSD